MVVRHKFVFSKYQAFQTPTGAGIAVIERCAREHGSGDATSDCPMARITTYTEGQERQSRHLEAADLVEWLK